jgi:hypothetical protein
MDRKKIQKFDKGEAWADLECLLSYEHFSLTDFEKIINFFLSFNFTFKKGPFCAFELSGERIDIPTEATLAEFLNLISNVKCNTITVGLLGFLHDMYEEIVLCLFPEDNVVLIYCIESYIWGHTGNLKLSDARRIKAFFNLCKDFCDIMPPKYGYIGPEEIHSDQISVQHAQENDFKPYNPNIFSDESVKELLEWYIRTYRFEFK